MEGSAKIVRYWLGWWRIFIFNKDIPDLFCIARYKEAVVSNCFSLSSTGIFGRPINPNTLSRIVSLIFDNILVISASQFWLGRMLGFDIIQKDFSCSLVLKGPMQKRRVSFCWGLWNQKPHPVLFGQLPLG